MVELLIYFDKYRANLVDSLLFDYTFCPMVGKDLPYQAKTRYMQNIKHIGQEF